MMKILYLIALLSVITALFNQCSSKSVESQNQGIDKITLHNENSVEFSSFGIKPEDNQQMEAKNSIQNLIDSNAALSKLPNLKDKELLDGETEVRILVGGGLGYPRWFILNNQNGVRKGFNVKSVSVKGKVSMEKIELNSPRNGWEGFENYLAQQGIKYPLQLSLDKDKKPYFDGEIVVVEVKSGNNYDVIYYSDMTDSEDGRKVIDVCRMIKEELNISLIKDWILKHKK